jgi:allantoin racemase
VRILLYNPNTDEALTETLAAAARRSLEADDRLETANSGRGAAFIGSNEMIAVARAALGHDLPKRAMGCDAVVLGCFGDLGVDALRRQIGRPILSLSDAVFTTAPLFARRIGIVTTSPFWAERLAGEARRKGAHRWIAEIRPIAIADRSPAALAALCCEVIADFARHDRCDSVILGGAILVGLAPDPLVTSALPILDPIASAIGLCRTACRALQASYDA